MQNTKGDRGRDAVHTRNANKRIITRDASTSRYADRRSSGNPVKITVAVYDFPDKTGQRKQVGLSTAVSQGADVWVIQSLMAVAHGDWFTVVERASLDNLVKERQLIRSTRELYDGSAATDQFITHVVCRSNIRGRYCWL